MSEHSVGMRSGFGPGQLYRLGGAALMAALPLHVAGFVLHPASEGLEHVGSAAYGPAHVILFASSVLLMLGLPALYARQGHRAGRLGLVGFVMTMGSVAYHLYLTAYEAFAVPVMADQPATRQQLGPDGALAHGAGALGPIAPLLMLGFPLLGVATLRAGMLPRASAWLQISAVPAFVLVAVTVALVSGETGPEADGWISGMLPIASLYWVLSCGYALAGLALWRSGHVEQVDGVGLPGDVRRGVGLRSMGERAAELGGSCAVMPRTGGGTSLRVELPHATLDRGPR